MEATLCLTQNACSAPPLPTGFMSLESPGSLSTAIDELCLVLVTAGAPKSVKPRARAWRNKLSQQDSVVQGRVDGMKEETATKGQSEFLLNHNQLGHKGPGVCRGSKTAERLLGGGNGLSGIARFHN